MCIKKLAYIRKKYPVLGLHLDFAEKKQRAQLKGLFTEEKVRGMMEKRQFYTAGAKFWSVMALNDRSLGFMEKRDLTRVKVLKTEVVNKVLLNHTPGARVKEELIRLRSKTRKFKSAFEKAFGLHCSSDLSRLGLHFLDQLLDELEKLGGLSSMDERPIKSFNELIKNSCKMTSCLLATKLHEIVENIINALDGMQRYERAVSDGVVGTSVLRK